MKTGAPAGKSENAVRLREGISASFPLSSESYEHRVCSELIIYITKDLASLIYVSVALTCI